MITEKCSIAESKLQYELPKDYERRVACAEEKTLPRESDVGRTWQPESLFYFLQSNVTPGKPDTDVECIQNQLLV